MKKKILVMLVTIGLAAILLIGCNANTSNEENTYSDSSKTIVYKNNTYGMKDFVDPEYGVHYWIYEGSGITPRLKADGSLLVEE